jgi:hypothetical protein
VIESWIAFMQAITVSEWVVVFLTTKPIFIVCTVIAFIWSRRGRTNHRALPAPDQPALLEAE